MLGPHTKRTLLKEEPDAQWTVVELDDLDISIDEDGLEGDMHSA